MGCHFLLQEIFPTQGLNPGLLHCRQTLLLIEPPGKSFFWRGGDFQDWATIHSLVFWQYLGSVKAPLGVSFHLLIEDQGLVLPAILVPFDSNWFMLCPSIQLLSCVWFFVTPWTAALQASLSITNSKVYSNSWPLSRWCHPTISSSVVPFSSCLQSFPASGSFPMS